MALSNWEADKMLDVYIYDYLVKKKLHATAKSFMTEGKVAPDPVAIDAPGGFLFEWWSVFWDIFIARTNDKHSEAAAAYIEQIKTKEQQQQLQMLQMQQMRHAQMQRRDPNHPPLGPLNPMSSEGVLGQSTASALAAKMYEERMKHPNPMDSETSQPLLDARMALLKSATNHPGQLVPGNQGSVNAALQQIQARTQQNPDIKPEVNMANAQRSLPMDPSMYGQGMMQSKPGIGNAAGLNPGVSGLPLKGWPLTGIDQIRPGLGAQVQKPFLQNTNQFQLLPQQQQQQILSHVQGQGNLTSTTMYGGDMDAQRLRGLPRGPLNAKDGQSIANDGSIGSPMQSTSSKINMQQSSSQQQQQQQQQQDPLQPQQVQQNNRKRKGPTSSGAANSTGTGNTVGPSPNSQPSTPSTHTPGDGVAMAHNLQNVNSMTKSVMMYGADGTGGLASSTNQLEDMDQFGDVGSLEDNVDSFLSHDDGDGRDLFGTLKRNPEHATEPSKGFSFNEVSSIRKSNSKVVCCHFSSDGKILASAGHDKKVVLWNMDTLQTDSTPEEHSLIITDVRFRPNSTQLATSSFDTTVRLWDAADPSYVIRTYSGHTSHVLSLDFHPKKTELMCSCDANNEIRYWNLNQYNSTRVSKASIDILLSLLLVYEAAMAIV
ncbi:transcriptional corepressor LEUNIG_HOMOLOG [Humulus lupulus]|uniref:transcriptional corepressor LEUNIG_HOMOLOG n=1 Tax=Humulus lupulus TaxID=3486 RepID=UPI002B410D41|nr:transcriptional corepressor LEUNIG_HOMOLOG [Humulus lupulus]